MITSVGRLPLWLALLFTILAGPPAEAAYLAASVPAVSADSQLLIAHGSEEQLWLGVVRPAVGDVSDAVTTSIYVRSLGEPDWHNVTRLQSRAVSFDNRGSQLAVLVEGGAWYLVSDDSVVTGPSLENGGQLLTFGNDGRSLWAVGRSRSLNAATSEPSTAPAARDVTATAPTTPPAAVTRYHLYWLGATDWNRGAELPPGVPARNAKLSLAFIDREPYLAVMSAENQVALWRLHADGRWTPAGTIQVSFDIIDFKLLSGAASPMLWIAGPGDHASFHCLSRGMLISRADESCKGSTAAYAAAAFAAGRVRVLTNDVDESITEHAFGPFDPPASATVALIRLPADPHPDAIQWILFVSAAGLIATMLTSVRHRAEMRELATDPQRRPSLAPIYRRLIAGIIDASPLLVAAGVLFATGVLGFRGIDARKTGPTMSPEDGRFYWSILIFSGAVYLTHTVFVELVAGRSLGKMIMRLRVVGLDGKPAAPGAILGRNAMRVVDLAFLFLPLGLIFLSPLRQRAGDIVAGTIVVTDAAKPSSPAEEPPHLTSGTDRADK